MIMIAGLPSP